MMAYLNQFMFGFFPYIAIGVMVIGSILRYDRDPYTWKADSSQLLRRKGLRIGSNFFHIGILLLFVGHFVGLLTPHWVYEPFVSAGTKQLLAMIAGGIFGVICLIGLLILTWRRLMDDRVRATSRFSDTALLILLLLQLMLGLATIPFSAQHLDGSSMIALAEWAQHILTFRSGAAEFMINEAPVFKAHIALGLFIFLIFPFTRLVHMLSVPVKYFARPGYQIVRRRGS